jgi:CheY-like chemotaxis protein
MAAQDKPRTVLIADDDGQLRLLLKEFLQAEGFDVLEARDGVEALQTVQDARPDAMLLDIAMPRLGGLHTLESIRTFDPHLHVIIMTGKLDQTTLRDALFSEATTVLTKPLDLDDVVAALRGKPGATRREPAARPAPAPSGTRRILVVDDELEVRTTISEMLSLVGYDVSTAADGPAALDAIAEHRPDIVLLDVQMPGIDGIGVLASIRALDPNIKVIMISGVTRQHVANQAFEQGVFDYIGKPVDPDYLELSIATALDSN